MWALGSKYLGSSLDYSTYKLVRPQILHLIAVPQFLHLWWIKEVNVCNALSMVLERSTAQHVLITLCCMCLGVLVTDRNDAPFGTIRHVSATQKGVD
jgi:hypothetical protein